MLQFLLDDTLPGYSLPKRRLRAGRLYDWSIDTISSTLSCSGSSLLHHYHLKGVVAVRVVGHHNDYETVYSMRCLLDTNMERSFNEIEYKKLEWKDLERYLE
jgi:hypothetical protein